MARRQPYQQSAPTGAPSEADKDSAFETTDGGLQINLSDLDLAPPADPAPQPEQHESQAPLQVQEPAREPARDADDEAYSRLKAQLDRTERERQEAQSRLGQAEKERSTYEGNLRAERERGDHLHREHLVAQGLAIDNALRVAENAATAAQDTVRRALENADYEAVANAQVALTQAYNDIGKLREGKQVLEAERAKPAQPTAPARQEQRQDGGPVTREPQTDWERVEAYITQPQHPPRVQSYMRQHYDDLFANSGARVNKLVAAHYEAKAMGLPDFSDDYFNHVDRYMGYDNKSEPAAPARAAPPQAVQSEPAPKPKTPIPPAAPVSRSAPPNQTTGTSITLNPAQVAFCKESGIDPKVYARQMLTLNRSASDPNYTGPRWTKDMGV